MQVGTENTVATPPPTNGTAPKEIVTPHNVAVLLLVNHHLHLKYTDGIINFLVDDEENDDDEDCGIEIDEATICRYNRKLCLTVLRLIHAPDTDYKTFLKMLNDGGVWSRLVRRWQRAVESLVVEGVAELLNVMGRSSSLISTGKGGCAKYSVLGLYLRRVLLTFDKLTFSQVVSLVAELRAYASTPASPGASERRGPPPSPVSRWTRKEAQQLFSKLLTEPPAVLQDNITHLLHHNPDLPEAHFLSFLNCVRSKELWGAKESLHQCFDRALSQADRASGATEDRSFRYGTLNLAAMHILFGHKEEGRLALKEVVRLAHSTSDSVCLQHAMSWLYHVTDVNKDTLLHRAMARSSDLDLPYLMCLAIQTFTKHSGQTGGRPSVVFDVIMKSDEVKSKLMVAELPANSLALRSSLWSLYGHSHLSSLYSQLLLRLQPASHPTLQPALCLALCNVARSLADEGEYESGVAILTETQELFPLKQTKPWMVSYQEVQFSQLVNEGRYNEAADCITLLAPLKPRDAAIRRVWLHHLSGADVRAVALAQSMLRRCHGEWFESPEQPPLKARVLMGAALCLPPGESLRMFMEALSYAQYYHLHYLAAVITMCIANVMLELLLSERACRLVESALARVMSHGTAEMRGRALLLLAHCRLSAPLLPAPPPAHLLYTAHVLTSAQDWLLKAHDHVRLKHCWYLKAIVHHSIGNVAERNKCAFEFRQLEEIYPTPPSFFMSFW